jgi:predicted  nucleic acid-binding Zn-ribbon protein
MTPKQLEKADARLAELNDRDKAIRAEFDRLDAEIEGHRLAIQKAGLAIQELRAERARNKVEYGDLYERVGKARKAAEAKPEGEANA